MISSSFKSSSALLGSSPVFCLFLQSRNFVTAYNIHLDQFLRLLRMKLIIGKDNIIPYFVLTSYFSRSDIYRDKVLREIIENNKETKVMSQRTDQHPFVQEDNDVSPGHVLHAINMDYAAFYGNHHLSNNMAGDDSDDDEQEQRTFSSHPYLIT